MEEKNNIYQENIRDDDSMRSSTSPNINTVMIDNKAVLDIEVKSLEKQIYLIKENIEKQINNVDNKIIKVENDIKEDKMWWKIKKHNIKLIIITAIFTNLNDVINSIKSIINKFF